MTEPEQPETPPLTRKRMRDIRNTGATPVVTSADVQDASSTSADAAPDAPVEQIVVPVAPTPVPPLPRAAPPVVMPDPPVADMAVDLGVTPLTRRQARQQERIRTASVPVITPDVIAAHMAASAAPADAEPAVADPRVAEPEATPTEDARSGAESAEDTGETPTSALRGLFSDVEPEPGADDEIEVVVVDEPSFDPVDDEQDDEPDAAASLLDDAPVDESAAGDVPVLDADTAERPVVNPLLGAALFADDPAPVDLPPSFDDLLARGSTGSIGTSSALIFSPPSGDSPIVAPVTATGEVLITGTFNLPEGLGSLGHTPGTADGREADAVLVDGELPAHSSPTPIAASAAISTVKSNGDVIKPPVPEKGSRLMMWLAITAGVLALALVGVLILAFVNGVF